MRPEHWLFTIPLRLRSLFSRAHAGQELNDELCDHLERATEEYVAKGMTPEEARRLARFDLGGIEQTKEKCRDARRVNWIQDLAQDLRYGLACCASLPDSPPSPSCGMQLTARTSAKIGFSVTSAEVHLPDRKGTMWVASMTLCRETPARSQFPTDSSSLAAHAAGAT